MTSLEGNELNIFYAAILLGIFVGMMRLAFKDRG